MNLKICQDNNKGIILVIRVNKNTITLLHFRGDQISSHKGCRVT
jgi:hypothetical protein